MFVWIVMTATATAGSNHIHTKRIVVTSGYQNVLTRQVL